MTQEYDVLNSNTATMDEALASAGLRARMVNDLSIQLKDQLVRTVDQAKDLHKNAGLTVGESRAILVMGSLRFQQIIVLADALLAPEERRASSIVALKKDYMEMFDKLLEIVEQVDIAL
ncbi:MAG: hypothetical protein AAF650_03020 [Pseudomonadota bacterium]